MIRINSEVNLKALEYLCCLFSHFIFVAKKISSDQ